MCEAFGGGSSRRLFQRLSSACSRQSRRAHRVTEYRAQADDHLLREQTVTGRVRTPVNFIVHSLADVNAQLKRGRPFFCDILRDGIVLHEAPDHPFVQPQRLSQQVALTEARASYVEWFASAERYLVNAIAKAARHWNKEAAFLLHQSTERFYHCTSLVLTFYDRKSHKLNYLRSQAELVAPALIEAWPRDARFAQRAFELLRRAYVDVRYSPHDKIRDDELTWLIERVEILQQLVRETCCTRLNSEA